MKYFALPRIASIISRREEKIRSDISKAEEIKTKIEQTNKELQLLIDNTDNEIKNVIKNIQFKKGTIQNVQLNKNAQLKKHTL